MSVILFLTDKSWTGCSQDIEKENRLGYLSLTGKTQAAENLDHVDREG